MKKLSLLLILAILSVVSASAETVSFNFQGSSAPYGLPTSKRAVTFYNSDDLSAATTDIGYWATSSGGRVQGASGNSGKDVIVITAKNGCKITNLELVAIYNPTKIQINGAAPSVSGNNVTWSGESDALHIASNGNAYFGITSMVITYSKPVAGNAPEAPVFDPATGTTMIIGSTVKVTAEYAETMDYTITGGASNISETDVPAVGQTINVTMPSVAGNYTLTVTAKNDNGTATGSATYNVYIPAPGSVHFSPNSGVIDLGSTVNISANDATALAYTIVDENDTQVANATITGDNGSITMPTTPGVYTLTVTASNDGDLTTVGTANYIIVDTDAQGEYVRCRDASLLKAGSAIYIGDPYQTPFTLMGDIVDNHSLMAEDMNITITNGVLTNPGNGVKLYMIPASDGNWYLIDGDNKYLYSNQANFLQLRDDGQKSEYTITIDNEGKAHISTFTVIGAEVLIAHDTLSDSHNIYTSLPQNNITGSTARTYPVIYYQGTPEKPADIIFNPEGGEVEIGDEVTITSVDATSLTYTYAGKTVTVDGETATVKITEDGTIEVTATNAYGTTTGSAAYTIKVETKELLNSLFDGYTETNWVLPDGWAWSLLDGSNTNYSLKAGNGVAYDPTEVKLPSGDVKITITFEQNMSIPGNCVAVRTVTTDDNGTVYGNWLYPTVTSIPTRADFQTAEADISALKGNTVQIGLRGKTSDDTWQVKNLSVTSQTAPGYVGEIPTGIDEVIAADEAAPVYFYNLQGMRVNAENMTPGIYIRQQGRTTTKILVK